MNNRMKERMRLTRKKEQGFNWRETQLNKYSPSNGRIGQTAEGPLHFFFLINHSCFHIVSVFTCCPKKMWIGCCFSLSRCTEFPLYNLFNVENIY